MLERFSGKETPFGDLSGIRVFALPIYVSARTATLVDVVHP
jgi:hypothetical protein